MNHELNGADRPTSGATFGITRLPRSSSGASPAAATADGLLVPWSTIRLEIVRGCESKTKPLVAA